MQFPKIEKSLWCSHLDCQGEPEEEWNYTEEEHLGADGDDNNELISMVTSVATEVPEEKRY